MAKKAMAWYALYCMSGTESSACMALRGMGIDAFSPQRTIKRRKKIARSEKFTLEDVQAPVFANYAFANTEVFAPVLATRGVIKFVTMAGELVQIPDRVIAQIQAVKYEDAKGARKIMVGDIIEFGKNGSLASLVGCVASVADLDKKGEIKAWVDLFGSRRNIKVKVDSIRAMESTA